MTTMQFIAMLSPAIGGLLVGGFAYWIATRPEKRKHHPAE
jgi:hypothetical protein